MGINRTDKPFEALADATWEDILLAFELSYHFDDLVDPDGVCRRGTNKLYRAGIRGPYPGVRSHWEVDVWPRFNTRDEAMLYAIGTVIADDVFRGFLRERPNDDKAATRGKGPTKRT